MRWWWRKRPDNFEWRDYVRTTILVRRNERRQKVEDAKQAAIFGVKQAGQKGVEAGAAGLGAAGRASKAAAGAVGRGGAAVVRRWQRGASFGAAIGQARGSGSAGLKGWDLYAGGAAQAGRRLRDFAGRAPRQARIFYACATAQSTGLSRPIQGLLRPSIAMPLTIVALVVGAGAISAGVYRASIMTSRLQERLRWLRPLTLLPRAAVGDVPAYCCGGGTLLASCRA